MLFTLSKLRGREVTNDVGLRFAQSLKWALIQPVGYLVDDHSVMEPRFGEVHLMKLQAQALRENVSKLERQIVNLKREKMILQRQIMDLTLATQGPPPLGG